MSNRLRGLPIGRTTAILTCLLIAAVLLRLVSALAQGNQVETLPGIYDQLSYHRLAQRVLTGYGFSFGEPAWPATRANEPTAHWSFLYTLYLSGVYAIAGVQPVAARIIQAVLAGVLHCFFAWRIARRLFGERVGLYSVGVSAFYIYFFYYAGALMTEPFYIVGILWALDAALQLAECWEQGQPARLWRWLALGLAVGVTTLLRQLFILFVPFLFVWLWWRRRQVNLRLVGDGQKGVSTGPNGDVRPFVLGMVAASLVVVALILPWTVRNYRAFDTLTPLNTNAGYAFFWGNHPIYGTDFQSILPAEGPSYYELIPPELRSLNEAELDQALLRRGLGFITEDPLRIALLSISRIREYFKFWPSAESSLLSNVARVASFGVALPFMIAGLWLAFTSTWKTRTPPQKQGIVLLILFAAVYSLIHLLTWALIRYRLPVDAVMLIFAALALERAVAWLTHHKSYQRPQIL